MEGFLWFSKYTSDMNSIYVELSNFNWHVVDLKCGNIVYGHIFKCEWFITPLMFLTIKRLCVCSHCAKFRF